MELLFELLWSFWWVGVLLAVAVVLLFPVMVSSLELRESEMSTCGTLGHALEVATACTSYMRGA